MSSTGRDTALTGEELRRRTLELVPVLRERAARTEELRQIPTETVQDLVSSSLIRIAQPIVYRAQGFFLGRELYFLDPSGNMLELRDPTWKPGMPQPTYEEIIRS